jgi:menaquinone-specific isochorismate synthase
MLKQNAKSRPIFFENDQVPEIGFLSKEYYDFVKKKKGAYLPHWTMDGAAYHVTFRLHDSMPESVVEKLRNEREQIWSEIKQLKNQLSEHQAHRLLHLYSEKLDRYLDEGFGACMLKREAITQLVADALQYFDHSKALPDDLNNRKCRYRLLAWCIMPNHVHAAVQPLGQNKLPEILHSWKSFTANKANLVLGRTGHFWQAEYYDHIIRNEADLIYCVDYIYSNPENAGIIDWHWKWKEETLFNP